jgi:DNA-binding GntR family transcriptional regulator
MASIANKKKEAAPKPPLIKRSSLQQEITSLLREEIVEGVWEPGVRLQERVLCDRYGVSRSPLREAFQVMASEGLLKLHPNRGAVVTRPTITDALENIVIVKALECLAIRLACERGSDAQLEEIATLHGRMHGHSDRNEIKPYFELNNMVHEAIVRASGNSALVAMHEHVDRHITRLQKLSGALEADPQISMQEHDKFINALLQRDKDAAEAALKEHLDTVTELITQRLAESE